jgi:hypothetical protein
MPEIHALGPDPLQPARDRALTASDRLFDSLDRLEELEAGRRSSRNPTTRRRLVASLLATRRVIDATLGRLDPGAVARPTRDAPLRAHVR